MGRSWNKAPIRGTAGDGVERADIRSDGPSGVAVRQATSPGNLFGEAPPPRPSTRGPVVIGVVLAVLAAALVAVLVVRSQSSGSTSTKIDPVATLPANPPGSVDPAAETKAAIIDAYKKGEELFVAIGRDPQGDPFDPRLKQYLAGDALFAVGSSLQVNRTKGDVYRGDLELHPSVTVLHADDATIRDCAFDHTERVRTSDGVVTEQADKTALWTTVVMQRQDGVWKEVRFKREGGECVPSAS